VLEDGGASVASDLYTLYALDKKHVITGPQELLDDLGWSCGPRSGGERWTLFFSFASVPHNMTHDLRVSRRSEGVPEPIAVRL
jgi:hypothetical protein